MSAPPPRASGDSYCGIYCGACDVRLAGETGHRTRFAAFWTGAMIRTALAARGIVPGEGDPLELRCGGCKSDVRFVNCRGCGLRACAEERKVARCSECADFPCAGYRSWRKSAALLPHVGACEANLETIRSAGAERWLAEQDARWRCPACGSRIAWYSETCGACGAGVRERTFRLSPVRTFLLKLALRLAPKARAAARGPSPR